MKKFVFCLLASLSWLICHAGGYVPSVCPTPAHEEISATDYSDMKLVTIECNDTEQVREWACRHLEQWYGGFAPDVRVGKHHGETFTPGAYTLIISKGNVRICTNGIEGVRYALYSLRQLAIPARGTETVQGWIVPETVIEDYPDLEFRGLHLCWFPETDPWDIEKKIRLAAYYKLNYVVIESWGTFRSEIYPWLGWADGSMTKDEIARLRGIADDLGVCLIPQFNVFGHASGSRIKSGKHDVLDFAPEYQPLFEPEGGWNWCLSNPNTLKVQIGYINEMLEAFGNPPYFHIGCDEARPPSCPDCISTDYSQLLIKHISSICSFLSEKGTRAMMWHDMLLDRNDSRWSRYAHGTKETAAACNCLPKDIIICDWFYDKPQDSYPSLDYFKSFGFDVLTCPWQNLEGILAQGSYARKTGMYGILGTIWHKDYGVPMAAGLLQLADAAWSSSPQQFSTSTDVRLKAATHFRQIEWDMEITEYWQTGFNHLQVLRENTVEM